MGIVAAVILAPISALFFFVGYQIRYRGRVEWISGVTDASALETPQALGHWVGGTMLALAVIMASAVVASFFHPQPQRWVARLFVIAVLLTVVVGLYGGRSRGRRKAR